MTPAGIPTKQRALKLLDRRDYSRGELMQKLVEKGEEEAAAEAAVDALVSLGFVDDARYAGLVVRQYAGKGYGVRRIKAELQRRLVPRELWETALEQMPEQDGRIDRFLRQRLSPDAARTEIRKVTDALRRRGYGWDEISAALERFRNEEF